MQQLQLVASARDFSLRVHKDLFSRTVNGFIRPQAVHLQEVADLVWISGGTDEEIAAAWLHDTVEDTTTTLDEVRIQFGDTVAALVEGVTDTTEIAVLPLVERKQRQAMRLREENNGVRRIKYADQISNVHFLAIDATVRKTPSECVDYIDGARLIAAECRGISPLLDGLFEDVFQKACKKYLELSSNIC